MKTKYKTIFTILGSGSSFDTKKLNSSFLIKNNQNNEKTLIDCGYNIFSHIKSQDLIIKEILVTNTHFNHVGSLETLIYYNYYIKGFVTKIYSTGEVLSELKCILKNINKEKQKICHFIDVKGLIFHKGLEIIPIKANYTVKNCYGYIFKTKDKDIIISGDSKANINLVNFITNEFKENPNKKIVVFHDYSGSNEYNNIFHCCDIDFKDIYEPLLTKYDNLKFVFYQNEENQGYQENLNF